MAKFTQMRGSFFLPFAFLLASLLSALSSASLVMLGANIAKNELCSSLSPCLVNVVIGSRERIRE